jgi:hypothetical protein
LTFLEYVEHTNEMKLANTLQLEEQSNWSPLNIERIKLPFLIFLLIHTNSTYTFNVCFFKKSFAMLSCLPNWCNFDRHIFALVLWLIVCLQQVWDLLLLCLSVLVKKSMCCCAWVWGEFVASLIPFAFENKNIRTPPLTVIYRQKWKIGPSCFGLVWW